MGSENNMVAVPGHEATFQGLRLLVERAQTILSRVDYGDWHADAEAMLRFARLASPQPDAQQGEADQNRSDYCPGYCARGEPHNGPHDPVVLHRQSGGQTAEVLATPPSPALDAATIERCAQVAKPAEGGCARQNEYAIRAEIAAAIRALPNAEKKA